MTKKKDDDLKQVMAEERSRGRSQPVKAVNLENQRRIQRIVKMLADRNCQKRDYLSVIREDFGLKDESQEFRQYEDWWRKYRGEF